MVSLVDARGACVRAACVCVCVFAGHFSRVDAHGACVRAACACGVRVRVRVRVRAD